MTKSDLLATQMKPEEFERLMRFVLNLAPRSAVFTNIYQGLYRGWNPIYWLVDQGGVLSARGKIFANR